jgi:hypothetical protein
MKNLCISRYGIFFHRGPHLNFIIIKQRNYFTGRNENEFAVPTDYYSFNRKQIPKIFSKETILTGFAKPYTSCHNRMTTNPNSFRSTSELLNTFLRLLQQDHTRVICIRHLMVMKMKYSWQLQTHDYYAARIAHLT